MKYLLRMRMIKILSDKNLSLLKKVSLKRILKKNIFRKKEIQMKKSEIPGGIKNTQSWNEHQIQQFTVTIFLSCRQKSRKAS